MNKHTLYRGQFASKRNALWQVEIWGKQAPKSIGMLSFPEDSPLLIEWGEVSKEEPLCPSTATLRIVSPDDRSYQHLYSIEAGSIGIDILREGALWWRGTLDPEFYEEPYERRRNYIVELTFSDFGLLDRLKYRLTGLQQVGDILRQAIEEIGLSPMPIDNSLLNSRLPDHTPPLPDGLAVRSDNFIDEDGQGDSLKEVITAILQPLGARLIQRDGRLWIYDLHGLHQAPDSLKIKWCGANQTMGVDKVANAVNLNYSPYGESELLKAEVKYTGSPPHPSQVNLPQKAVQNSATIDPIDGAYYSFTEGFRWDDNTWDYTPPHTTIHLSPLGKGLSVIGEECRYFSTLSHAGGSREEGVAVVIKGGADFSWSPSKNRKIIIRWPERMIVGSQFSLKQNVLTTDIRKVDSSLILRSQRVWLPTMDTATAMQHYLRLSIEMLLDARYNPFSSEKGNLEWENDTMAKRSAFAFVPFSAVIYDAMGTPILHYDNSPATISARRGNLTEAMGEWKRVADAAHLPVSWLEWYDIGDTSEKSGIGQGFKANRHNIGRPDGRAGRTPLQYSYLFGKIPDGEYLPYPPQGGWLEISIYKGVKAFDANPTKEGIDEEFWGRNTWVEYDYFSKVRWWLFKAPKIEVVGIHPPHEPVKQDDIEHRATLNPYAAESLDLDLKLGTLPTPSPVARGILFRSSSGLPLQKMARAGKTASPEELLIGTLYSQFAQRRTTLSGDTTITRGLCPFNEACQGGKRFLMVSETQNLRREVADAKFIELRPDEYKRFR